jgi:hypothetical protein
MPEPTVRITNLPARSTVDPASLVAVVDLTTNETVRLSLSRLAEILGLADEDMIAQLQSAADAAVVAAARAEQGIEDMQDGVAEFDGYALLTDSLGNVLLRATPDGLDFIPSENVAERLSELIGNTISTIDGDAMFLDANGNVIMSMRRSGLDFVPSDELLLRLGASGDAPGAIYQRQDSDSRPSVGYLTGRGQVEERVTTAGRTLLRGTASDVNVTVDLVTVNGQSLSVGDHFNDQSNIPTMTDDDDVFVVDGIMDLANAVTARGWLSRRYDETASSARGSGTGLRPFLLGYGGGRGPIATAALGACGALNHHRRKTGALLSSVVTVCHGYNGVSIENMDNRANTGNGETTVWDNLVYWYDKAKEALDNIGVGYRVPWHVLVHGTSAKSDSSPSYYNAVLSYMSAFRTHLNSRGLFGDQRLILTQSSGDSDTSSSGEDWDVKRDQLRLAQEGYAVLAGPLYPFPIDDGNVHPNGETTMLFGEMIARAMAEEDAGRAWTTLGPVQWHTYEDGWEWVAIITLDTRPGEALRTEPGSRYPGGAVPNLGFEADGASIVENPTVSGNRVTLRLDGPPTRIRYALQSQDVRSINDGYVAHRGLVRTNYSWKTKWQNTTLYRWVPSFEIEFPPQMMTPQ